MGIQLPSLQEWSEFCRAAQENHDLICLTTENGYRQYKTMTIDEYKNFKSGWHNCCHKLSLGEIVSATQEIFRSSTTTETCPTPTRLKRHFKSQIMTNLSEAFSAQKISEAMEISELAVPFLNSSNESVKEYRQIANAVDAMQARSKTKKETGYAASTIGKIVWFFWNLIWNQEKNVAALNKQVPDEQGMRKLICHAIRFQIDMNIMDYATEIMNTQKLMTPDSVSDCLSKLPKIENSKEASETIRKIEIYNDAWKYYNLCAEAEKKVEPTLDGIG